MPTLLGSNDCHRGRKLTRDLCVPRACFPRNALDNFAVAMVRPRARVGSLSSSELINCLKPTAHQAGKQRDVCLPSGLAVGRLMRHGCEESDVVSGEERPQLRCHIIPVTPCILWHPTLRRLGDHVGFSPTAITDECSPNSLPNYARGTGRRVSEVCAGQ
jgi:hypothetical protein